MPGKRIWMQAPVVALIAWLDHCIDFKLDFDATIVKVLEDHQKQQNADPITFTPLQISDKLVDLSRSNTIPKGDPDYPKLRDVKKGGSKCFPGLKPDMRKAVDEAVKKLAAARETPQNQLGVVPKLPHHGDNAEHAISPSGMRFNFRKRTTLGRNDGGVDDCRYVNKSVLSSVQTLRVPSQATESRRNHDVLTICNNCRLITSAEEINHPGTNSLGFSWEHIFEERLACTGTELEIDPKKWNEATKPLREFCKHIVNQNSEEVRRLRSFHEIEMIQLTRDRDNLSEENVHLTAQNRHLEVAHENRKAAADHDPLEGDLFRQNRIISDLMKQNAALLSDIPYVKEVLLDQPRLIFTEAYSTAVQIQTELELLVHVYKHQSQGLATTSITPGSKLEILLRSIRENSTRSNRSKEITIAEWLRESDVQLVLGHLVLTTVKKQVFYTDFPASGSKNFWWTFLQEHRKIQMGLSEFLEIAVTELFQHLFGLTCTGGWQQLSSRDKLAYKRIIESEEFEKICFREATQHSNSLIEILAPLFGLDLSGVENPKRESPYTPDNLSKDVHFRLLEIFRAALKFKSLSLLTNQRYEFAVHSLGHSFEDNSYPADLPSEQSQVDQQDHYLNADLWRIASLRIYEAGPRNHLNPFNDALVKAGNFVDFESAGKRCEPLHTSHIMCHKSETSSKCWNTTNALENALEREAGLSSRSNGMVTKQVIEIDHDASETTVTDEESQAPSLSDAREEASKFRCNSCLESFSRADHLKRHQNNNRCFICSCSKRFKRLRSLENHRKSEGHAEHVLAESSVLDTSVHRGPQQKIQISPTQDRGLDDNLQARYTCGRCDKSHNSQKALNNHTASKACSQCEICHKWSQSEEDHVKHWNEYHLVTGGSTLSRDCEGKAETNQFNHHHERSQIEKSRNISKNFTGGTTNVTETLQVDAPVVEDASMPSPEGSALASNAKLVSSLAMVSQPTKYKTTNKRAHDPETFTSLESSINEESPKRQKSETSDTASLSRNTNQQHMVNNDSGVGVIPNSSGGTLRLLLSQTWF